MTSKGPEWNLIEQIAEKTCDRITRNVIRQLQNNVTDLMLGADTGLKSVWEAICVQEQGQQSTEWDAYESHIDFLVTQKMERLELFERNAIWLQTDDGFEWRFRDREEAEDFLVNDGSVLQYIVDSVRQQAVNWSNQRIRNFQERPSDEFE